MTAFYNENDPKAAAWLRELIAGGHIAPGVVDERDIQKVREDDLAGFTQVHLFAGIGGWSLALRLAGWPDDRPAWTGSCPCQPFSSAGAQKGTKDARHLWPWMRHLIFRCRPAIAFGEQVASKLGRQWLAGVRANLETLGYAVGAADLCAAGVAAPHIRQRLFWMADSGHNLLAWSGQGGGMEATERREPRIDTEPRGMVGGLADAPLRRLGIDRRAPREAGHADERGAACGLGNALVARPQGHSGNGDGGHKPRRIREDAPRSVAAAGAVGTSWSAFDIIPCRDGKTRRVESGTFPLAHGISGRVGKLRGYGNAIVPALAARFIIACTETAGAK